MSNLELILILWLVIVVFGLVDYRLANPKCCGKVMRNLGGFGFDAGVIHECALCGRKR